MLHAHWSRLNPFRLNVFARDGEIKADFGEEKLINDESIVGKDIRDSQGSDDDHDDSWCTVDDGNDDAHGAIVTHE